jgi:hypothetical protein
MNSFSHGVRVLAKKPGFTAAAVLVLALGIGANTAIFSLVNAFLLKPVQIYKAEELVGLYSRDTAKPDSYRAFSYPNFADLRGQGGVYRRRGTPGQRHSGGHRQLSLLDAPRRRCRDARPAAAHQRALVHGGRHHP